MTLELALRVLTIACLGGALVAFVAWLPRRPRGEERPRADFGLVFSAFVAAWILSEMANALFRNLGSDVQGLFHFAFLGAFAVWIVFRWRWALRSVWEGG